MGELDKMYEQMVKAGIIPDYLNLGIVTDTPYVEPKPYIEKERKFSDTSTR